MCKAVIEVVEEGEDERLVADLLADVYKGVGEGLEIGAVVGDRHVALRSVPELRFELESPLLFVVAEEVLDGVPDEACRGAGAHDDAEKIDQDGTINLGEDSVVITAPI